jgi:hypothetical protein
MNGNSRIAGEGTAEFPRNGSLRDATVDRLACLLRHWTWADEAMTRFKQELSWLREHTFASAMRGRRAGHAVPSSSALRRLFTQRPEARPNFF